MPAQRALKILRPFNVPLYPVSSARPSALALELVSLWCADYTRYM